MPRFRTLFLALVGTVLLSCCHPHLSDAASPPARPAQSAPQSDSTLFGVVWHPPTHPGPVLRQLSRLHDAGVQALRLPNLPKADALLTRADSLGLQLFVDLPVGYVSAAALDDALSQAQPALSRLQRLAQQHPSLQYVGLARGADTTDPVACDALAQWTRRIHDASSLRTYYVTPFSAATDRCAGSVDRTLLDTRGVHSPISFWQSWADTASSPGIGALGTWTDPAAASGLRVPHSAERQARHLERALGPLVDSLSSSPSPVFVYHWRDRATPLLDTRRYGLHTRGGTARPAASVLTGFYTGVQRVFAFPIGPAPSTAPNAFVLLGWGLLALLGGLYAQSPYVRETAVRYFAAHGFYRDAVKEGRDVNTIVNVVLLMGVGLSVGMVAALSARIIAAQPSTLFVLEALPRALRAALSAGLAHPLLAGSLIGGVSLLLLLVWMGVLILAAQADGSLSPSQGLMLVTWPCWPAFPGMLLALVAATAPPASPELLGLLLLMGGLCTLATVTVRVLRDFGTVTNVFPARAVALLLPSPLVLVTTTSTVLAVYYELPLALLWHLAAHT